MIENRFYLLLLSSFPTHRRSKRKTFYLHRKRKIENTDNWFSLLYKCKRQKSQKKNQHNQPVLGTGAVLPCCSISFSNNFNLAFKDNFSGLSSCGPVLSKTLLFALSVRRDQTKHLVVQNHSQTSGGSVNILPYMLFHCFHMLIESSFEIWAFN